MLSPARRLAAPTTDELWEFTRDGVTIHRARVDLLRTLFLVRWNASLCVTAGPRRLVRIHRPDIVNVDHVTAHAPFDATRWRAEI